MSTRTARTRVLALLLVIGLVAAACGDDDSTATTGTAAPAAAAQAQDVVETAVAAGSFTVLVEAVQAAGLVDALKAPGPITVFAPTDEAFAAALRSLGLTKAQLLADKDTLTAVLTYHVVSGEVKAADVVKLDGKSAETLNGADVEISVQGGNVFLNGDTKVVQTDIDTSNGVIHVIDKVLLPPA
jgi:transforming growth factor-beta-induced protein